jgi:hypothetical protein
MQKGGTADQGNAESATEILKASEKLMESISNETSKA